MWVWFNVFMIYAYYTLGNICLNQQDDLLNFVGVGFMVAALVTCYFTVMGFFDE